MANQQVVIGQTTVVSVPIRYSGSKTTNYWQLQNVGTLFQASLGAANNGYTVALSGAHTAGSSTVLVAVTVSSSVAPKNNSTLNVYDSSSAQYQVSIDTVATSTSPDFTLTDSVTSQTIAQGSAGTNTVTISSVNGFNAATALTLSAAAGITGAFSPSSVTPASGGMATSTLTLSVASSVAAGNYTVTITGASGALTHTVTIALTVTAATVAQVNRTTVLVY